MDPISAGLLVAVATGAAGEAGRQLWTALSDMIRRRTPDEGTSEPATGQAELVSLSEAPHDVTRAQELSLALSLRAQQDPRFAAALTQWRQQAQTLHAGAGDTTNTVSGGEQHGPLLQGRDFSGITFNVPDQR
jgi:hypothetical protein